MIYLRQGAGGVEQSSDRISWAAVTSWPITLTDDVTINTDLSVGAVDNLFVRTSGADIITINGGNKKITSTSAAFKGIVLGSYITVNDLGVQFGQTYYDNTVGSEVGYGGICGSNCDNVNITNCYSIGTIGSDGGGICGSGCNNATITECSSSGNIGNYGGGICGKNCGNVNITNCHSTGTIGEGAGGICGYFCDDAIITDCYSTGNIGESGGGICGYDCDNAIITNCYSIGTIGESGGGICGIDCDRVTITNCYSTGDIGEGAGGICGYFCNNAIITNCYSIGTVDAGAGSVCGINCSIALINRFAAIGTGSSGVGYYGTGTPNPSASIYVDDNYGVLDMTYYKIFNGKYLLSAFSGNIYDSGFNVLTKFSSEYTFVGSTSGVSSNGSLSAGYNGDVLATLVNSESIYYGYTMQLKITVSGGSGTANICLQGDTQIQTDQGVIRIDKLSVKNTIGGYQVRKVTCTLLSDTEVATIGDMVISLNHLVLVDGKVKEAGEVGKKIPYMKQPMYNIVLDEHAFIWANGIQVETLHPGNPHAM